MTRNSLVAGFTLIEVLVVLGIVSVLFAILVPALSIAQDHARRAACLARVRQLGTGVYAYAADYSGCIPAGPGTPADSYPLKPSTTWAQNMSNWIWVIPPLVPQPTHNAQGVLLDGYLSDLRAMTCPGTDAPDYYAAELENYRTLNVDIYSAYLYRQWDQVTRPQIENLGVNDAHRPARALFADANSLLEPVTTNHRGRTASVGYIDGHVKTVDNRAGWLTAREQDYASFPASLLDRIAVMVRAMDYSEYGDLNDWSP